MEEAFFRWTRFLIWQLPPQPGAGEFAEEGMRNLSGGDCYERRLRLMWTCSESRKSAFEAGKADVDGIGEDWIQTQLVDRGGWLDADMTIELLQEFLEWEVIKEEWTREDEEACARAAQERQRAGEVAE